MNTTPLLRSSFVFGVGRVGAFLALDRSTAPQAQAEDTKIDHGSDLNLASEIKALRRSVADLERLIASAQPAPRIPARLGQDDIAEAVAAYLANSGPLGTAADGAEASGTGPKTPE